jgi:Flp pilus assembly protein TadD
MAGMCRLGVLIALLLMLGGCASGTVTGPPPLEPLAQKSRDMEKMSAVELLAKGESYLAGGSLPLARLHLLAALGKDPDSAAAWTALGEVSRHQGRLADAGQAWEKALQKDPAHVPALLSAASLQRQLGETAKALALFQQAEALRQQDAAVLSELAITCDMDGQWRRAEAYHRQALALRPEHPVTLNNLGFNLLLQERFAEALPLLQKAYARAPQDGRIGNNLALAHALAGHEQKALRVFEQNLGAAAAQNNLGYVQLTRGELLLAQKSFQRALAANPRFYARARENLEQASQKASQGGDSADLLRVD